MAEYSGTLYSYSATLPHKRVVSDRIILADPMTIVAINALGLHNESKFAFVNTPGTMYEWLQDTYAARSTTAAATNLTNDSTTTTIVVATGTGAYFQIGDVIQIDSEYIWVSSISTNTLTVTRNFGGTQATHASTSTIYIRYNARVEKATSSDSPFTEATSGYNYSTILHKQISISRTNKLIKQYGIENVVEREIDKAMDEKMMQLNKIPYHGQRVSGGSTSSPTSSGGLSTFITTNRNTLSGTPALLRSHIEDEVQDCWDAGGNPTLLLSGGWAKRKITGFFEGYVRTDRSEKRGGIVIDHIDTPLGLSLELAVDRHCPSDTLYILDTNYVGFITLDDFFYEELGKTADTADHGYGQVVGEYGFVCAFNAAHSIVSGFSTST
jgi:hypothetical protein